MPKEKTTYYCQSCGAQSPKWIGKCPGCGEWNSYVEEVIQKNADKKAFKEHSKLEKSIPVAVPEISSVKENRIQTPDSEFNRVLGSGIVPGSLILIGGEPGIGKSTLMLQVALRMKEKKILYVTGEESQKQIRLRAERVGELNPNCFILAETSTQMIFKHIASLEPDLVVIDSIQTLHTDMLESSAGSVSQIRECTSELQQFAKQTSTPVLLVGHITKDGYIAGPKVLEHMVDTVLQFEGDRNHVYRILRSIKNRFGSASELGIYEMRDNGLREVDNPSEVLITNREENLSGISVAATIEGMRPVLIEIQALVSSAVYGTPQRSSTGFDLRRLSMLLAVLEKRCGFRLGAKDVFLNIAGGIKVDDPAIDLAVVASILSSNEDVEVDKSFCFAGEIGLSGEIRSVNRIEQRISEAEKLGFEKIIISKYNMKGLQKKNFSIEIVPFTKINEVVSYCFG